MEQLIIKHADGSELPLFGYEPARSVTKAEQNKRLLGEDTVSISVDSSAPLAFQIGDSIDAFGEIYVLNGMPIATKNAENQFVYELGFEGAQYSLQRVQYLNQDVSGFNTGGEFSLTGDLTMFIGVLMNNVTRALPNWSLGGVVATTEKTLAFNNEDGLAVLQRLCAEFNVEPRIEYNGNGRILFIQKTIGTILPYSFAYGRGKGLGQIKRQFVSQNGFFTRLYAYGGTKNLPGNYRNYSPRLLFASQPDNFLENATTKARFGLIEATKTFDDIYPHRTGTVSGVAGGGLSFSDAAMNFDLNAQLAPGLTAKVHFNTGNLAGYEFEVTAYVHATKTFTLLPFIDNGQTYPAPGAFAIAAGATYVLIDILMPQSYVDSAELELRNAAQAYMDSNSLPRSQYSLEFDEMYLFDQVGTTGAIYNWFSLGDTVTIADADLEINGGSRVLSVKRDLLNHYRYKLEIGTTYDVSIIYRQLADQNNISRIIKLNNLRDARSAKYSYENQQELLKLVYDPEGNYFTEKIKPLSIETSLLAVGTRSQQFVLDLVFSPNYGGNPNVVVVSNGTLTHLTIATAIKAWQITGGTFTLADNNARYIYVRAHKTNLALATVVFDAAVHLVDTDPTYYYFLLGVLHSVSTDINIRRISLTYGFTTISGRFITTGRIQSGDGSTYFDLDSNEIGGNITFRRTDGTTGNIAAIDTAYSNFASVTVPGIQAQLDGKIESYFGNDDPNTWPAGDRLKHDGDMWYLTNTKQLFRYDGNNNVWNEIQDKDAIAAYTNAAIAQDTADGKRRTFSTTPYAPYDPGDLWAQGSAGDILVCVTGKAIGQAYSAGDWVKAGKYTGDEALVSFVNTVYNPFQNGLQAQIDGKIETFFTNQDPIYWLSIDNPKHDGDMWYKSDTLQLFRFDGNAVLWREIQDKDALAAFQKASQAKDTADGKRRVFTATPFAPYDAGDLWTQGPGGDLLVSIVPRAAGEAYNASDWVKAAKYTGDEAIIAFINTTYNPTLVLLQGQIDGKIESFFTNQDPNTWAAGDRTKHDGDMWYHTGTKELFRYDGNANVWRRIEDKDAIAAYETALQARDSVAGKTNTFVITPFPPYAPGDLWVDGVDLRRCIVARLAGQSYNPNDWVKATNYDNTVTAINGGVITSGTIQLVNGGNMSIVAGITGADDGPNAVRFFAGASFENRYTAPNRILQSGEQFVAKRLELMGWTGSVWLGQAGICGVMDGSEGPVRMWAGSNYENRNTAPWQVWYDGSMYATAGYIGNLQISNGYLSNNGTADSGVYISTNSGQKVAAIGTQVISAVTGINAVAMFKNNVTTSFGDNYGTIFEASGANVASFYLNYNIFAPVGTSYFSEMLKNGERTYAGSGSLSGIDPSLYDGIVLNPGGNNSTISFSSTPRYTLNNGKEIYILNDGTGVGKVYVQNVQRGNNNIELIIGAGVTLKYERGNWYVKSYWETQY